MPTRDGMNLRLAQRDDLPAIVAIYNSIIPGRMVTAELDPITVESRIPWLEAHDPNRLPVWVLEDAGEIVGWLSFDTFNARAAYNATAMIAIYVAEHRRHTGLGRYLLTEAIARAPSLGLRALLGYIFAHNEPSLRLFEKFGFQRWAHLPRVARLDGIDRDLVIVGKHV